MDLDWMWDITAKNIPLDVNRIDEYKPTFVVGVTDVENGESVFLEPDNRNILDILKASSAMPIAYRNYVCIDGKEYVDGGVANPIPIDEAIRRGATDIVVIRSRKQSYVMKKNNIRLIDYFLKKSPKVSEAIKLRNCVYNSALDELRNNQSNIRFIEVCPQDTLATTRFTTDIKILNKDYQMGCEVGKKLISNLNQLWK